MSTPFVWLASQSPRRRELLAQIGVRHELLLPDADEDAEALEAERPGESPEQYVQRVTRAKLDAALARWRRRGLPAAPVLCADTTVAFGRTVLGKPADAGDARAMLQRLSGHTHRVLTAVALAWPDRDPPAVHEALSVSHVRWRVLEAAEIEAYAASGEPMGKAGAYAIQSGAARWTEHIEGSYSGIMGLPLFEVDRLLRAAGRG
ncbi:MAG: Maf family nucleotide pyrophosphatase [Burkholderiaceae bacterium]|jgi:septum formation protein|nr:Maf family nucleotide pyrophosphatase [Burkholderiaceae bacterium]MCU0930002.1 Maf family nucleotide pyrophosphatase [Burkholderiaceae bacterium]